MFVYAEQGNAYRLIVVDLRRGEIVPLCLWANDDTGVYCVHDSYKDRNRLYLKLNNSNNPLVPVVKRGQIAILDPERPDDKAFLGYLANRLDKLTPENCSFWCRTDSQYFNKCPGCNGAEIRCSENNVRENNSPTCF